MEHEQRSKRAAHAVELARRLLMVYEESDDYDPRRPAWCARVDYELERLRRHLDGDE